MIYKFFGYLLGEVELRQVSPLWDLSDRFYVEGHSVNSPKKAHPYKVKRSLPFNIQITLNIRFKFYRNKVIYLCRGKRAVLFKHGQACMEKEN